jgi:protein SCO1
VKLSSVIDRAHPSSHAGEGERQSVQLDAPARVREGERGRFHVQLRWRAKEAAREWLFVATTLFASAASAAPAPERTLLVDPPRAIADFQLTEQSGKAVKLTDLRGTPLLVFFGFTHCSTACPVALHQLRQLERMHKAELGKTRIVIISVDGERDTPDAMKQWLKPMSEKFIGLTGPPARVHNVAATFSAAFFKQPGASATDYQVEHTSQIFLVDSQGRLRATFFNAPLATMAEVTRGVTGK